MKQYPKFPDPVEVPTFAQNSKWAVALRPCEHQWSRIEYGHGKEMFKCKCCGKTIWD